jgi:hypothetical protein
MRHRQSLLDFAGRDRERAENNRERYGRIRDRANGARVRDPHFSENLFDPITQG